MHRLGQSVKFTVPRTGRVEEPEEFLTTQDVHKQAPLADQHALELPASSATGRIIMPMTNRLYAEFLGTAWLVLGGCGSAVLAAAFPQLGIGFAGVALAFGLTVVTMAYVAAPVSGAHFNPAITVGLAVGGRFRTSCSKKPYNMGINSNGRRSYPPWYPPSEARLRIRRGRLEQARGRDRERRP
jgi:hypothetical protein